MNSPTINESSLRAINTANALVSASLAGDTWAMGQILQDDSEDFSHVLMALVGLNKLLLTTLAAQRDQEGIDLWRVATLEFAERMVAC